jgi:hypothetical protein
MQNPEEREREARLHDTVLSSFDPLENASLEPIDSAQAAYKKEPLFNKKVMLVWAIGAAVVWFAVSFVLPIAFESAKSAIVQSIKEAEGTGSNIIIQRDGQQITITTKPAKPAKPPKPAVPAVPAAGTPVPAAAPANPTNPQGPAELQSHRR